MNLGQELRATEPALGAPPRVAHQVTVPEGETRTITFPPLEAGQSFEVTNKGPGMLFIAPNPSASMTLPMSPQIEAISTLRAALQTAPDPAMYRPDEFGPIYTAWFETVRAEAMRDTTPDKVFPSPPSS